MAQSKNFNQNNIKIGGRPQSIIRSWFIPVYINNKLAEEERNKLENVFNYRCPFGACAICIRGTKLEHLANHVLVCQHFPQHKKGICCPSALSLYIPSTHAPISPVPIVSTHAPMRYLSCIAIKFNVYCSRMIS